MAKKNIINPKAEKFLFEYLNANAPTGFEWEGQKKWVEYIKPFVDKVELDNYGTAYGIINPDAEFRFVIEAHADEIAWYVSYITDDGYIYVKRNGGSDVAIAPSMRVWVHTDKKKIQGVFGWPAIHMRKNPEWKDESPSLKNIFVDVGCSSKKEVEELGIRVGHVITFQDELTTLNKNYYVGRALDNRMGGFMISQVARLLHENKKKLKFGLYIVNSVQEEVGLRGAEMITQSIKPNAAIVTDVTHDTSTPMVSKILEGDLRCGRGPVCAIGPAVHNKLHAYIMETANKNKIDVQLDSCSRATGTDTDAFAYSNGGVPSALISLPMKYMHTTVETVHKDDVESVIELMYQSVIDFKTTFNFKYF